MKPAEAARLLGLNLPTTEEAVQTAFRGVVKFCHPDHGLATWPYDLGPPPSIDDIKLARSVLLVHVSGVKPACNVCGSRGVVRSKSFKLVPCPKGCKVKPLTRPPARRKS